MRVILSIFLLKEIIFKHSVWQMLYSNTADVVFDVDSIFAIYGLDVFWFKQHYLLIIYSYIFFVLLFLLGVGRNVVAALVFLLLLLLQKINNVEVNGGDILLREILFWFCFVNAYEYFSVFKKKSTSHLQNLMSNLGALSMMIQLCIAYFLAFVHKIENPYWQNGSAMYYILNEKPYVSNETICNWLSRKNWFVYLSTYTTLAIELLFPIFIWIKKCRKPLLIAGLALHCSIYILMMLYNLQFVFLSIYGLFLNNQFWINCYSKFNAKYLSKYNL